MECEKIVGKTIYNGVLPDYVFSDYRGRAAEYNNFQVAPDYTLIKPRPSSVRFYVRLLKGLKKERPCTLGQLTDTEVQPAVASTLYLDDRATDYWTQYYNDLRVSPSEAEAWVLVGNELVKLMLQYVQWYVKLPIQFAMLNQLCRSQRLCRRRLYWRMPSLKRTSTRRESAIIHYLQL